MKEPPDGTQPAQDPFAVPLSDVIGGALWFQSYEPQRPIADVTVTPLKKHRGENGWFMELWRAEGGVPEGGPPGFEVRQLSAAWADPYRLNAFHLHPKIPQREVWMVARGELNVWLVDCRRGSSTEGVRQRVLLSSEEPAMLHIPAGVAHGYRAGGEGALLIYGMDQQFDRDDPNEGRLPWDFFGAELWEEDVG